MGISKYTLFKLSMSGALVALAVVSAALRRTPYAYLAMAGMALGMVGDMCLARVPWVKRVVGEPFLAGVAAFSLGHVCCIAAFCVTLGAGGGMGAEGVAAEGMAVLNGTIAAGGAAVVDGIAAIDGVAVSNGISTAGGAALGWVVSLEVMFALAVWVWVRRDAAPEQRPLLWPLLGYVLLIAAMASLGAALSVSRIAGGGLTGAAAAATAAAGSSAKLPAILPLLGGVLFLISDALIAVKDFTRAKIPRADALIWATYVPAQLCIVAAGLFL